MRFSVAPTAFTRSGLSGLLKLAEVPKYNARSSNDGALFSQARYSATDTQVLGNPTQLLHTVTTSSESP